MLFGDSHVQRMQFASFQHTGVHFPGIRGMEAVDWWKYRKEKESFKVNKIVIMLGSNDVSFHKDKNFEPSSSLSTAIIKAEIGNELEDRGFDVFVVETNPRAGNTPPPIMHLDRYLKHTIGERYIKVCLTYAQENYVDGVYLTQGNYAELFWWVYQSIRESR